jgi:hypothetical protein
MKHPHWPVVSDIAPPSYKLHTQFGAWIIVPPDEKSAAVGMGGAAPVPMGAPYTTVGRAVAPASVAATENAARSQAELQTITDTKIATAVSDLLKELTDNPAINDAAQKASITENQAHMTKIANKLEETQVTAQAAKQLAEINQAKQVQAAIDQKSANDNVATMLKMMTDQKVAAAKVAARRSRQQPSHTAGDKRSSVGEVTSDVEDLQESDACEHSGVSAATRKAQKQESDSNAMTDTAPSGLQAMRKKLKKMKKKVTC